MHSTHYIAHEQCVRQALTSHRGDTRVKNVIATPRDAIRVDIALSFFFCADGRDMCQEARAAGAVLKRITSDVNPCHTDKKYSSAISSAAKRNAQENLSIALYGTVTAMADKTGD